MDLREGGGNCLNYLERGCSRKNGKRHKDFRKGEGKLGQGVKSPYKLGGGGGIPLRTMYGLFKTVPL